MNLRTSDLGTSIGLRLEVASSRRASGSCASAAVDKDVSVTELTRTFGRLPEGVLVHGHGYSVQLALDIDRARLIEALAPFGFDGIANRGWKMRKPDVYVLEGSCYLTQRAPDARRRRSRRRLESVKAANLGHGLKLYALEVDLRGVVPRLLVRSVRADDLPTLLGGVMGLSTHEWRIVHFTAVERYICLTAPDAYRLAEALGCSARRGASSYARKFFLGEVCFTIPIRRRAHGTVRLSVYRITRGATCDFKVEARLVGRSQDRATCFEADIVRLDELLVKLVHDYGLSSVPAPSRWEPRRRTSRVDRAPQDRVLKNVSQSAYRGNAMTPAQIRTLTKCNTPQRVRSEEIANENEGFEPAPPTIRSATPSTHVLANPSSHPLDVRWWVPEGVSSTRLAWNVPTSPEAALVDEVNRIGGGLIELVLPDDFDPASYVLALLEGRQGRRVGVTYAGANSWRSVEELAASYPYSGEDEDDVIMVVDPTALGEADAMGSIADVDGVPVDNPLETPTQPLDQSSASMAPLDYLRRNTSVMGAMYWQLCASLREWCERTGALVVLVSVDHRTDRAQGDCLPSHMYTDARVRSSIGDAGRYHAHQRYRVEPGQGDAVRVVLLKDEAEGRTGRLLTWRGGNEIDPHADGVLTL